MLKKIGLPLPRNRKAAALESPPAPEQAKPFESMDELLTQALNLLLSRRELAPSELPRRGDPSRTDEEEREAPGRAAAWTRYFHAAFELSRERLEFCRLCFQHELGPMEREILLLVALDRIGLIDKRYDSDLASCGSIVKYLFKESGWALEGIRCLHDDSPLIQSGLLGYQDDDEDLLNRKLSVHPAITDLLLQVNSQDVPGFQVTTEEELYQKLIPMTNALVRKVDSSLFMFLDRYGMKNMYQLQRFQAKLYDTLKLHPDWGLSRLLHTILKKRTRVDVIIIYLLISKELGHVPIDHEIFTGEGLARALTNKYENEVEGFLSHLSSEGELLRRQVIQPCAGFDHHYDGSPSSAAQTEFELTGQTLELLGLNRKQRKMKYAEQKVREPRISFSQLVLSDKVKRALDLAQAQAKNANLLSVEWGMQDILAYGRGVTVLFWGPSGTGKTSCAEAVAKALDKEILVVDTSQIQSCFMGNTEKNIMRAFRAARAQHAVLFWDKADAMFFSRDKAVHSWEARNVAVLVTELERFDGVCILATTRKVALDPELERCISLKIEFQRPDREQRRQIITRLLPPRMPLDRDVDLERLADQELTGGELKNIILNAARMALVRDQERRVVTMKDLEEALDMEIQGRWG